MLPGKLGSVCANWVRNGSSLVYLPLQIEKEHEQRPYSYRLYLVQVHAITARIGIKKLDR